MSEEQNIEYREIPQLPGYRAGSDGSVWSRRPKNGRGPLAKEWRLMKQSNGRHGRLVISVPYGNKRRQFHVHHLILFAFVGPCPKGMQCRHYPDPNPHNNRLENIQWGTQKQNAEDSIIQGIQICGERCHRSKLNAEKVIAMRSEYTGERGDFTRLSKKYGIARNNVSGIIKRKTWKHLLPTATNGTA